MKNNFGFFNLININLSKHRPLMTVILLHGLAGNGRDFVNMINKFGLSREHRIKFIFPTAYSMPVTINNDEVMPSWFDVYSLNIPLENDIISSEYREDVYGIKKSSDLICSLIDNEMNLYDNHKVVLGGFSQGGALSLYTGLKFHRKISGIIALSCYNPLMNRFYKLGLTSINANTPIFLAHGLYDDVIPFYISRNIYSHLVNLKYNVMWNYYYLQHLISREEMIDIGNFLKYILKS